MLSGSALIVKVNRDFLVIRTNYKLTEDKTASYIITLKITTIASIKDVYYLHPLCWIMSIKFLDYFCYSPFICIFLYAYFI